MDATKFDDVTKALATSASRRHALKTIAATSMGGLLALAGIGTAFADDGKKSKKCVDSGDNCNSNPNRGCCSQVCLSTGVCL